MHGDRVVFADDRRRDVREYWSTDDLAVIRDRGRWKQLRSVVMVRSERTIRSRL